MLFIIWNDPTCRSSVRANRKDNLRERTVIEWLVLTDPGDMVQIGIWSIIEVNVTVICICIITVKRVLQRLFASSLIAKTRQGWSKLRSSHFSWGSNHDSRTRSQSKTGTNRLHEIISQPPAAINTHSTLGVRETDDNYKVPSDFVKVCNGVDVSDEIV